MNIQDFSSRYQVRLLTEQDVEDIFALCSGNPLYYRHCPPFVTRDSVRQDMKALPPHKTLADKYYLGFFDGEQLVAVMDLITAYPNPQTAFIGFFMMKQELQGRGVGTSIISELCDSLRRQQVQAVRLCWVSGNPQSEAFWHKNGFMETGVSSDRGDYTVVIAERLL